MPAKTRRDICRLQVIGECWRTVGSLGRGLGPGTLGTHQLRLHGQREPHIDKKSLEAGSKLSRTETLEETKRNFG